MATEAVIFSARGDNNDNPPKRPDNIINNEQFFKDLFRLKALRSYLIQEAIRIENPEALKFERLNMLQCSPEGRSPTLEEWRDLESCTEVLFSSLTEPLRRRFVLSQIPMWAAVLPVVLLVVAMASLGVAIAITAHFAASPMPWSFPQVARYTLPIYLLWLMLLGALGSMAFIGMNAIAVQQDITFDVSNRKLMMLRITLGAIFGVVLTLPFGFDPFSQLIEKTLFHKTVSDFPAATTVWQQAMLLLLPFVLGFSTPLVITVLNRLVDSVQAFFGGNGTSEPAAQKRSPDSPSTQGRAEVRGFGPMLGESPRR